MCLRCHGDMRALVMSVGLNCLKLRQTEKGKMNISYNSNNKEECPIVVFDNNVWGRMSEGHIFNLFEIKRRYSFRYFLTSVNCIETFVRDSVEQRRKQLQTMLRLCWDTSPVSYNIFSPEEEFVKKLGLHEFIDSAWTVQGLLKNIRTLVLSQGDVDVRHYKEVKRTDSESYYEHLYKGQLPARRRDRSEDDVRNWIYLVLTYFLAIRPLYTYFLSLSDEDKNSFVNIAIEKLQEERMPGRLLCLYISEENHSDFPKDEGDIYDILQYILPQGVSNRILITNETMLLKIKSDTCTLDTFLSEYKT